MRKLRNSRLRDFGIAGISVITLAALWTAVTPSNSIAQSAGRMAFAEMDLNDDGIVTKDEFRASAAQVFEGEFEDEAVAEEETLPAACEQEFTEFYVDEEELDAASIDSEFQEFDVNKDGKINFDEVQSVVNQELLAEFSETDADQDGFLSKAEFGTGNADPEFNDVPDFSPACSQALTAQGVDIDEMIATGLQMQFADLDQNRDDKISQAEYLGT